MNRLAALSGKRPSPLKTSDGGAAGGGEAKDGGAIAPFSPTGSTTSSEDSKEGEPLDTPEGKPNRFGKGMLQVKPHIAINKDSKGGGSSSDYDPSLGHFKAWPASPTDGLMSPCSKRLIRKTMPSALVSGGGGGGGNSSATSTARPKSERNAKWRLSSEVTRIELAFSEPFIMGSSSAARKQVLEHLQWRVAEYMSPDIDEKAFRHDDPLELPIVVAQAKADALIGRIRTSGKYESGVLLLTTDQVVLFKGQVREKPRDEQEAVEFLSSYSNSSVETVSAVVATHYPSLRQACEVEIAKITWSEISPEVVQEVVKRGEVFNCAGGFKIEDPLLSQCINELEGTMDSVLGLPVSASLRVLQTVKDEWEDEQDYKTRSDSRHADSSPFFGADMDEEELHSEGKSGEEKDGGFNSQLSRAAKDEK